MRHGFRTLRLLTAVTLAAASLALQTSPAGACSCAVPQIQQELARADGAFVGTFIERGEDPQNGGDFSTEYRFDVSQWVKGEGGEILSVWSARDGGACGLETRPGQTVGLFLYRHQGKVTSSLCSTVAAGQLIAATSTDVLVGEGPVAFAISGNFTEGSIALLDDHARPLGYLGAPTLFPRQIHACPGGTTVLAPVDESGVERIDLATGERTEVTFPMRDQWMIDIKCLSPDGRDFRIVTEVFERDQPSFAIWTSLPEPSQLAAIPLEGYGQVSLVGERVSIVEELPEGTSVRLYDPQNGRSVVVRLVPTIDDGFTHSTPVTASPDGTLIAFAQTRYGPNGAGVIDSTLVVADAITGEVQRSRVLGRELISAQWLDADRIASPVLVDGTVVSFDIFDATSLETLESSTGWQSGPTTVVDDALWRVSGSIVERRSFDSDQIERVHAFPAQTSGALIAFDPPFAVPDGAVSPQVGGAVNLDALTPDLSGNVQEANSPAADTSNRSILIWSGLGFAALALAAGVLLLTTRRRSA